MGGGWWKLGGWVLAAGLAVGSAGVARGGENTPELSRLRAALAGLTYRPPETSVVVSDRPLERWRPAGVPEAVRSRLGRLSLSLVGEGGYQPALIEEIFYGSVDAARRAREQLPLRQLDKAAREAAAPRPDAGTPDTADAARDWQAMAPGAPSRLSGWDADGLDDEAARAARMARAVESSSGMLLYVMPLAAAYTEFPEAGQAAAAHLAELVEDDYRAAACARAAFVWLSGAFCGRGGERDALLRAAADAAGDGEVAAALLGARIKDRRNLRDEATLLGRLERCVSIWYQSRDGRELLVTAGKELRGWEARGFAALLAGATYGTEDFPPEAVAAMLRNRPLDELAFELRELATGGAVLSLLPSGRPSGERMAAFVGD